MKLDIKTLLILFLSFFCIFFFSIWYLKVSDTKEYKILEQKFEKIQKTRDSLVMINLKLKSDFDKIQKEIDKRDNQIAKNELEILNLKKDLKEAKSDLSNNKRDLEETKKKIENLKKNPIKREDDDLIKSLKEKLK